MTTELQAGPWDVTRAEYHADRTCVSNGALKDFRASVPLYHGRYITREIPPMESSEAMNLGTAFHTLCLEPKKWASDVIVSPECDRRTKDGKATYAAFLANSEGKTIISEDENSLCHAMMLSVARHPIASSVLAMPSQPEQPIRWQDAESGLWVRNLLDWFPGRGLVIDLKKSSDPAPGAFAKSAANFQYHCQAALYSRGAEAVYGERVDFMFIVVGSKPPHEVCCCVLDAEALELGERMNRAALNELAERIKTGEWGSRFGSRIETVSLPRWVNYQG